jgi:hypothetical protein
MFILHLHYFQDIIFNFEKAYFILDELLMAGEMQVKYAESCKAKYKTRIIIKSLFTFKSLTAQRTGYLFGLNLNSKLSFSFPHKN